MLTFLGKKATLYRFILKFKNLKDETGVLITKGSQIGNGTLIGDGTRINGSIVIKGRGSCEVGKYGVFGEDIRMITSNHKVDDIVLQFGLQKQIGLPANINERKNIIIGHNVWIGDRVIILPGVVIGNSAIIAAGATVTSDVAPYSVVGGIPAKLIKYRFSKEEIQRQEELRWWDWSLDKMREQRHLLQTKEISK